MPELPEVETIKNRLIPLLVGRRILKVEFLWPKTLLAPPVTEFNRRVDGRVIEKLDRRGKYLILCLDSTDVLLVHLRMTGAFLISEDQITISNKHVRAVMYLDGEKRLYFIDPRKFGKFQLVSGDSSTLLKLGPEPMSEMFTVQYLVEILAGRKMPIKALLVVQSMIAGIGNMYADEALYQARIHPLRQAESLSLQDINELYVAIRQVLQKAIDSGGASVSDYFHPDGVKGKAQEEFRVAHRRGGNCADCGGSIMRIVVRQRGTYLCPKCQK